MSVVRLTSQAEEIEVRRLGRDDRDVARATFELMADVFGETRSRLSDGYLDGLLSRPDFWVVAAIEESGAAAGGLTAHTLPMTAYEGAELFVYDVAVAGHHQRRGIGRRLVGTLRHEAAARAIQVVFVAADNEDSGAVDFYRQLGGTPTSVTFFEFKAFSRTP